MDYFMKLRQMAGTEPIILSGAVGAVIKDGKILLVKRHNLGGPWGVPGGVQELGESIQQAAHRAGPARWRPDRRLQRSAVEYPPCRRRPDPADHAVLSDGRAGG
jgi:NUDIX domain